MKISYLRIRNFKVIKDMTINEVENALILVGKNNTGKTVVLDAIRAITGDFVVTKPNFLVPEKPILIDIKVEFSEEDLQNYQEKGIVSRYKRYDLWEKEFKTRLPSFQEGVLSFQCIITPDGTIKYNDGFKKNNIYIKAVFPKIYHIDHTRNTDQIQNDVFSFYDKQDLMNLRENICMFDSTKPCNNCFQCIGVISKKEPNDLTIYETARLLEYKLYHMNLQQFADKVNRYFYRNGSVSQKIRYTVNLDIEDMLRIETQIYNEERGTNGNLNMLGEGLKSIYALSLLQAYIDEPGILPCIIMIEDPEIYLHPQLQKQASEILYQLSKKNQVMFSTHSPNLIFNFSQKQIKQVVLDEEHYTTVREDADIDEILDDLGYTANDLMNVNFVFIVEGKQDSSRLPLLLEKYYSEIYDENGKPQRISIITTNSCTNIKTYANLKYINQLYLKDQFLMIRDSDGKNPKHLVKQLCSYYSQRAKEDVDKLPRVTPKNVLILKYYSFENYFLDPKIMTKIGVVKSEEEFYNILYTKWKDYLFKLGSTKRLIKNFNLRITCKNDLKNNMELIKTYVRGHNLFDIFYGRYRGDAQIDILQKYIAYAPRENFKDILDSIDSFVYFENRKK
ncbi:ATP-dependent nuclease [Anaerosporobacter faecicola]|uniref:ATP-dependent nuclease n=1 Tax=Anaerosporobacter faecicola TaxID=2718714 RepID=UPI00143C1EF7|nr:AAA family ATPase [Anaerosporobacter faecicola]